MTTGVQWMVVLQLPPALLAYLPCPQWNRHVAHSLQCRGRKSPSSSSPRQQCLLEPDRWILIRGVWPINLALRTFLQEHGQTCSGQMRAELQGGCTAWSSCSCSYLCRLLGSHALHSCCSGLGLWAVWVGPS